MASPADQANMSICWLHKLKADTVMVMTLASLQSYGSQYGVLQQSLPPAYSDNCFCNLIHFTLMLQGVLDATCCWGNRALLPNNGWSAC